MKLEICLSKALIGIVALGVAISSQAQHRALPNDVSDGFLAQDAMGSSEIPSNYGIGRILPFILNTKATGKPLTFISYGDSMADSYRSIGYHIARFLENSFGVSGYSFNNYRNNTMWYLSTTNASWLFPDKYWFMSQVAIGPGGMTGWERQANPNGLLVDRAGLFYVSQPDGGDFTVLISTNGGPWGILGFGNGYTADTDGRGDFFEAELPLNYYRIRVQGSSGTNRIIGPHFRNTSSSGVHLVFLDQGGIPLSYISRVSRKVRDPIFWTLTRGPSWLLWHMKEGGSTNTLAGLEENEAWWSATATNGFEATYVGTPWMYLDTNSNSTIEQNAVVRQVAVSHSDRSSYFDFLTPAQSYEWMLGQGYMSDEVHQNLAGNAYLTPFMIKGTGLYTVGASNMISSLRVSGSTATIGYAASTSAVYILQRSSNLISWIDIPGTSAVGTGSWRTNIVNVSDPQQFFRLVLSPP